MSAVNDDAVDFDDSGSVDFDDSGSVDFDDSDFKDIEAQQDYQWVEDKPIYRLVLAEPELKRNCVWFSSLGDLIDYTCNTFINQLGLSEDEANITRIIVRETTFNGYDTTAPIWCSKALFFLDKVKIMKKIL